MSLIKIVILAVIQGLAELLPVSSSAHVIVAAKLMKLDPSSSDMVFLLLMLHTGTMFAVIVYFWQAWKRAFFSSKPVFMEFAKQVVIATAITGVIGFGLKLGIEHLIKHQNRGIGKAEVEQLFKHLELIAAGLLAAGVLILISGLRSAKAQGSDSITASDSPAIGVVQEPLTTSGDLARPQPAVTNIPTPQYAHGANRDSITTNDSLIIGAVQGLCLPFRGFSRSGATISTGLLRSMARRRLEEFSFALAVVLTPPLVLYEARRLVQHHGETNAAPLSSHFFVPSLIGMACSFLAGLVALKLLSGLLERGKWWLFGVYCLVAAGGIFGLYMAGY